MRSRNRPWTGIPLVVLVGLAACRVSPAGPPPREPIRWVVVEKRVGDLAEARAIAGGDFAPEVRILALEPLFPEDLGWTAEVEGRGTFVEILEVTPPGLVAPGEVVTARVRVGNARPGVAYRLVARPSTPDVQIMGEAEIRVRGPEVVVFRFTSLSGGRGGIEVGVALNGGE